MVADALNQVKTEIEIALTHIVKEDTTDAARFLAMLQIKILITQFFETWMIGLVEGIQRVAAGLMKMYRVFLEAIIRCQVHAAAKPPYRLAAGLVRDQEAYVHVHGGRERIARMKYQR